MERQLEPTGTCWCGCGETTERDNFFIPGHDSIAEAMILDLDFGSRPGLLAAHGYGPGGKNLFTTFRQKYQPLADYLTNQPVDRVTLKFVKIEEILGDSLPMGARETSRWWNKDRERLQPGIWLNAGWSAKRVSTVSETVTFVRSHHNM